MPLPTPNLVLSGMPFNYAIAVDQNFVYWVGFFTGTINRVPLAGGSNTVLATGQSNPYDIAVDATNVYWTNDNSGIKQMPKGGGAITTLVTAAGTWHLAIDASFVYWTDFNSPNGAVRRVPIGGGATTTIATGQNYPFDLIVDGTNVYWTESANYAGSPGAQGIHQALKDGSGGHILLTPETNGPTGITVDSTHVYWINASSTRTAGARSIPIGGGTITELGSYNHQPQYLTQAGGFLYFGDGNNVIYQVDKAGAGLISLASTAPYTNSPIGIAVSFNSVYWSNFGTNGSDGSIYYEGLPVPINANSSITANAKVGKHLSSSIGANSSTSATLLQNKHYNASLIGGATVDAALRVHLRAAATITVNSLVTASMGEELLPMVAVSEGTAIRLYFDQDLRVDGAVDTANYTIRTLGDGFPIASLTATLIGTVSTLSGVLLQTSKHTDGQDYLISVSGLFTLAGDPFEASARFTAHATKPSVLNASALSAGQVIVTFSDPMLQDRFLTDPGEYTITGPGRVTVKRVQISSPTEVVLLTAGMVVGSHTLTVNATGTPHDLAGNPIDPTFNTAIFNGQTPLDTLSVFTDKGPIAKPPVAIQSGINATIVRPALTFDLQPHKDLTTLTLTGGSIISSMLGLYVQLTGSTINDGLYKITAVLSLTSVRVNANFHLPDPMNGSINWSVVDQREGQIADDPSDVSVTVNGVGVIPTAVIGLLGQVVLPTAPTHGDDVKINYSWIDNPTVDLRRLNSMEFRLNAWNRDAGYINNSRHHYRYNNTLVVPSEFAPLDMQATLPQPLERDLKYRAYERAYTPVLNDPNLLTLNNPIHKIAFPPLERVTNPVFVSYDATAFPENDPVAPWVRTGVGTTTLGSDLLTVTKTAAGPVPTGQVLFWERPIDLTFPCVFASTWRMNISSVTTTEGVFTGIASGFSDASKAFVVGYLNDGGTRKIGILVAGGDDPSVLSSWAGGLDGSGNPTGQPVAFDWTVIHSYRLYRDTGGTVRVFIDGNVTPTLQLTEAETPYLEELEAPFSGLQGNFFGSMSRMAANTSVWEFVRYNILPTNPAQTVASVFVTYDGNIFPEVSAQPWTPIGSAGTETTLSSTHLILDSTSATDAATEAAVGLVGGDFRGYDRIEPLLLVSSDVVLDIGVQIRTFTHGITPNAVMAAVDDGQYLVQLCFFPDQSAPKVSYGGRSLPNAFTPYTWTSMGGQSAAIFGRTLRITDTSVTDGRIYFIDDNAPIIDPTRVASPTTDYILEFRVRVESFTEDVTTHFCGVNSDVYDGVRSVGVMFTTVLGVPNVTFHSEGVAIQNFPFNWDDGSFHTYRVVKSTGGDLVSLFIDTTFIGTVSYSSFQVPGGSQVGVVSFGSSTPSTTGSLSVVDWDYCNCWRVLSSFNKYVGLWKGFDPNALTGYHFSLKAQGLGAQVNNNALGDGAVDFIASGVVAGDYIIVDDGPNKGQYVIASVSTNVLTITSFFPFGPTTAAYRIPAQTDWTAVHRYRVVRDPGGGITVLLDTQTAPLMRVGYNGTDLPLSAAGVPRVINGGLPGVVFGAFDPTNISQTSWDFVRYGITKVPSANRIVPPHQVLNQNNVIASYERQLSNLPHTITDFWSGSTGIPPEIAPDFLRDPSLVAFTLLNEGTPLVPSTQTFEVRRPVPMSIPVAALNAPGDVLNNQSFYLNNGDFETTLFVPNDVLYNSLQVIERDTGSTDLIAPLYDRFDDLGTLFFQKEVCLSYNAQTLPESDPTAATPWTFQADNPAHVQRSVFSGVLTFGTDATGTRAIYRNDTPLPDAVGLTTQVTFRLKLLSDASFGLGDSQVRFGLSATNMTLALGFVTTLLGERYLFVYDQNTGAVVGGRRFDFLDGNYHKYRVVRNPSAGTVSVFIDS